jgi:hypothetical protein
MHSPLFVRLTSIRPHSLSMANLACSTAAIVQTVSLPTDRSMVAH